MKKDIIVKVQPLMTKATLNTPFGQIQISPTSVGTASISKVTDEEFIKKSKKASKEDLFTPPDNYGQPR